MKVTLLSLAALAAATNDTEEPVCNEVKAADLIPVDNDCEHLWRGLQKPGDVQLHGDGYALAACSPTCHIGAMVNRDTATVPIFDIMQAAGTIIGACGESTLESPFSPTVEFNGDMITIIDGDVRVRTSVYKGRKPCPDGYEEHDGQGFPPL